VIISIVAFAGEITAAKSSEAMEVHRLLLGCWQHDRRTKEQLIGSYLVCFRKDGRVTGVTFDGGDAWEWRHDYRIKRNWVFFGDTAWGHVQKIAAEKMIIEMNSTQMDFELLCRTKRENIQCERLKYRLAR
jgi:hypothetical protein